MIIIFFSYTRIRLYVIVSDCDFLDPTTWRQADVYLSIGGSDIYFPIQQNAYTNYCNLCSRF